MKNLLIWALTAGLAACAVPNEGSGDSDPELEIVGSQPRPDARLRRGDSGCVDACDNMALANCPSFDTYQCISHCGRIWNTRPYTCDLYVQDWNRARREIQWTCNSVSIPEPLYEWQRTYYVSTWQWVVSCTGLVVQVQ